MTANAMRLLVLGLISLSLATGCSRGADGSAEANEEDTEEAAPIPVEVKVATRGDVEASYTGTVSLEAYAEARVIAKVGGEVVTIAVEEGDKVKAGQLMARLDGDRLRLEVERNRANVAKLRQDYQRNVELHEKGLISTGTFESQRYELEALQAALDLAELDLSYTQIRAPIDGVIAERMIKVGNTIKINDPVFQVTRLDPLLADLFVPERDFNKLAAGLDAHLRVDALPGRFFKGVIARISPVVDPQTGTFKVTIEVEDPSGALKPGMFGRVGIVYDIHRDAVLVPRVAVVDDQTDPAVFVVEEGLASRRPVTTGYAAGENIEILTGLDGGERVVIVGQNGLKDGGKVEVISDLDPPTDPGEAALAHQGNIIAL